MKTNFYRLTKKELSFISFIESPVTSKFNGQRLSRPAVVVLHEGRVIFVWTLSWYRYNVRFSRLNKDYDYRIYAMY